MYMIHITSVSCSTFFRNPIDVPTNIYRRDNDRVKVRWGIDVLSLHIWGYGSKISNALGKLSAVANRIQGDDRRVRRDDKQEIGGVYETNHTVHGIR